MKLGKKIGPLPAWGWGVLVLAVLAYFFMRAKSASAAPPTPSTSDQPAQASGAAAQDSTGGVPPAGIDPSILQALMGQNAMLSQSLINALQGAYGNYGTATGAPASAAPSDGAGASPAAVSAPAPEGAAAAPMITGATTPEQVAATSGTAIIYGVAPGAPALVGIDARMAHPSPAQVAAGAKTATAVQETQAHQAAVTASGTYTSGF